MANQWVIRSPIKIHADLQIIEQDIVFADWYIALQEHDQWLIANLRENMN